MIAFETALRLVRENAVLLGTERVPLARALGRVLRRDVRSDVDMPPFDKSAMDGYACLRSDLPGPLELLETIPAGQRPSRKVGRRQCSKIMTGSMLPKGADCVIMVEETETLADGRVRHAGKPGADNICRKGEDVKAGDLLVASGTLVTSKVVASLALAGCVKPLVSRMPAVGVLATGDELVAPGVRPKGPQIRDTNSAQALAQALQAGCSAKSFGIVPDREADLDAAIEAAASGSDLLIITGGVSMGDFDLVPARLKAAGFDLLFEKVAVQPGKPTVFGRKGRKFVFGMPGNPVSSFIVFEYFVKELLAGMTGLARRARDPRFPLASDYRRRRADRLARVPVRLTREGAAQPVEYHGSAHVTSLAGADGVISVPAGRTGLDKGELVDVRPI
ncbi:MAG: molybdopterin molybdotransferase MoeA [Elusimicrobia bacterium]|nr:molybdopterin molybdotransferase MoeA [Elusimicrobiota bacterium]